MYRSRRGSVRVGETGIEILGPGLAFSMPWYIVGHLQISELGRTAARVRFVSAHLNDGRLVPLPAPCTTQAVDGSFDQAVAEIFRAWRASSRAQVRQPLDEIPPDYRAAAAREFVPVGAATQRRAEPEPEDAVPGNGRGGGPAQGTAAIRRWLRRFAHRSV